MTEEIRVKPGDGTFGDNVQVPYVSIGYERRKRRGRPPGVKNKRVVVQRQRGGPFKLSPWQEKVERALHEGATSIYIKAGRKAGKTEYLAYRMKEWARDEPIVPEQINPYIAPARTDAKNIMWRRIKQQMREKFPECKVREVQMSIDMETGTRLQLFGADRPEAVRGLSFGPTIGDEVDFYKDPHFFSEVMEPNLAVTAAPLILASTPKNRWFTKRWRDAADGTLGRGHAAFKFTIYDNPYLSTEFIESLKKNVPVELWEQEYLANESAYTGLMYREFKSHHIVPHKTPPDTGKFARVIDWGMSHPTHVLWAEMWMNAETGRWNIYVYKEISLRGQNVDELATPILANDNHSYAISIMDISGMRTEIGTGKRIINQFAQAGVRCRPSIPNNAYNINCAKTMLSRNDIQISDQCPILIRQLRGVEWTDDEGDDAVDCLKYLCGFVMNREFTDGQEIHSEGTKTDPYGLFAAQLAEAEAAAQWSTEW